MPTLCERIQNDFIIDCDNPMIGGIDDLIVLYNVDEVTETLDPLNPQIITNLTPAVGKRLYMFEGTNNGFNATAKQVETKNGPRYVHDVNFTISGNSTTIKKTIHQMGYGRVKAIIFNNYKTGDSGIECLGYVHGLQTKEGTERNTGDQDTGGGYKIMLGTPKDLLEPNWPKSVAINSTTPVATPGTVTPTGSTTGGTLAAGAKFYKVTALNANGETLPSAEATVTTTGSTSSVALAWAAVSGATKYRVYRGTTTNNENVYYEVLTNSYTDINAAPTASGTPPTVNTTGIGVADYSTTRAAILDLAA